MAPEIPTLLAEMARSEVNAVLRRRIETGIGLLAPMLDLVLAVGDRTSRLLGSEEPDHIPARARRDGDPAPRGLPTRGH
jgi:hypothetical protein